MGWLCIEENTPFVMKRGQQKKTLSIVSGGRRKNLISCKMQCPIWMGLHMAVKRWEARLSAARGPHPDLICTRPTEGSSCWVSCQTVFPIHVSRSSQPWPVNTQMGQVRGRSQHLLSRWLHLAHDSSWAVSSQPGLRQPGRTGTCYCWAPSLTPPASSDACVSLSGATVHRSGTNSPQKARRYFCWLKGLGKGCVGLRANMGRKAESIIPLPTITPGPSRHSLLNYIHTTQ